MIPAFVLLAVAIAWRLLIGMGHRDDFTWIHNFAPLAAIALCGAFVLPRRVAIALPLVALFATDIVLNNYYEAPLVSTHMISRYVALALIACAGWWLRKRPQALTVLGTSALCSVGFYFLTNTASWITDQAYVKSFEGWAQALTGGTPGYPPTLTFFRNSVLGDVLFTALFVACLRVSHMLPKASPEVQPEPARWA